MFSFKFNIKYTGRSVGAGWTIYEEEEDEDEEQGDGAPSKQQSSQKHLAMLVLNFQKEVATLRSTSQVQPVDELSSLNLHSGVDFH